MQDDKHTLTSFDAALDSLRKQVHLMADLTERQLSRAGEALFLRKDEFFDVVENEDTAIDELEKAIDDQGMDIIARFQPVAVDLREVVSAIRTGSDIERVADQAVSITRRAHRLNQSDPLPEIGRTEKIFHMAVSIFHDATRSFATRDEELARSLKSRDRELDAAHRELIAGLTKQMAAVPSRIPDYLDLIFITRIIERIGDHGTNIAEDAVFLASAEDIRHTQSLHQNTAN